MGIVRIRSPAAENSAFVTAGRSGGKAGSPNPVGGLLQNSLRNYGALRPVEDRERERTPIGSGISANGDHLGRHGDGNLFGGDRPDIQVGHPEIVAFLLSLLSHLNDDQFLLVAD